MPALVATIKQNPEVIPILRAIGPEAKAAVPVLTELFNDKEGLHRSAVARALAAIDRQAALAVFTEALIHKDPAVREVAVNTLGRCKPTTHRRP